MKAKKNIWELQHSAICKVVGMALDFSDLKKISRKFRLVFQDSGGDQEFALHSAVVGMCRQESRLSKHVQGIIEKRFSRYAARLAEHEIGQITESVLSGAKDIGIPLWAILWHLAAVAFSEDGSAQTALFGRIHMFEHELLKDYWHRAGEDRDERETRYREEVDNFRRELVRLRSLTVKLEKANQRMAKRLSQSGGCVVAPPSSQMTERPRVSSIQDMKIAKLQRLLEESRERNRELEEECSQSRKQIEILTNELVSRESADLSGSEESLNDTCNCPLSQCLRGKRIAMVGGVDSLEAHYRRLVEQSGGDFCRHDGRCCRGERKLEKCIRNADLVVCPVSINSHFGASSVKKVCRRYGITCCFPDSAGLGSLRATLIRHFARDQEIPEESAPACGE